MKRFVLIPAAALALSAGLMATSASAAPAAGHALKSQSVAGQSLVETVRHRCRRVCKGWGFKRKCKMVCRHHHHRRHRH